MPSQFGQDDWVIRALGGLRNGVYLDIGAGDPEDLSNTERLEGEFGWTGALCDIETAPLLRASRSGVVYEDALAVNWAAACAGIARNGRIDYLSLDLEPPLLTLIVLNLLPLSSVRFSCLTIEHDAYRDGGQIRAAMRAIMAHHGYTLAGSNRGLEVNGKFCAIDDWWIDPLVIPMAAPPEPERAEAW